MLSHIIILTVLAFIGTVVQTVAGFGITFFILPALLVFFNAPSAVTISLLVGDVNCLLILLAEKRKREFSWPIVLRIGFSALPGLIIGAFILTRVNKQIIQIVVGILIIIAALIQQYAFPKAAKQLRFSRFGAVSGFVAGILNAAASMAPPPLVLWLRSHVTTTNQVRDTLSASFLIMNNASIAVIYFFKPVSFSGQGLLVFVCIAPFLIIGHQLGRRILPKIQPQHYHKILLAMVFIAGVVSISLGIANLH